MSLIQGKLTYHPGMSAGMMEAEEIRKAKKGQISDIAMSQKGLEYILYQSK